MFRQGLVAEATKLTLNHLLNYNFHSDWKIPIAPEAYKRDRTLFGDQYSNFNAGKILLYLEGIGGLKLSLPNQTLTVKPGPPPKHGTGWRFAYQFRNDGLVFTIAMTKLKFKTVLSHGRLLNPLDKDGSMAPSENS